MSLTNGLIGRKAVLKKGTGGSAVTVANIRTKSVSINDEPVDITSDSDAGWRTLLAADPAEKSVEITADGILKSNDFIDEVLKNNSSDNYIFEFDGVAKKLSGNFRMTNLEVGASYNDAVTFSFTLQSSGAITHA